MREVPDELNLPAWVARAPAGQRHFREAVHIILTAIGTSTALRSRMVMKGGLLMAIRYDSSRYTKDADFSTRERHAQAAQTELLAELERQLVWANQQYDYDAVCRCQKAELRPARPDANFPTLGLSIGYAPRSKPREWQRLQAGQAPTVVEIDYSYNEAVLDVEVLRLSDGDTLQAYSQINLMAEKFRSLLQQPLRRRNRRQDVYDLYWLLQTGSRWSGDERQRLLDCLIATCLSRGLAAQHDALRDPAVQAMAAAGYDTLQPDIDEPLPLFAQAYLAVQNFYENLPWPEDRPA